MMTKQDGTNLVMGRFNGLCIQCHPTAHNSFQVGKPCGEKRDCDSKDCCCWIMMHHFQLNMRAKKY